MFEGERVLCKDNFFLDEFLVEGLPALPVGQVKFAVTFEIDVNGILKVTVQDSITKKETKVTVNKGKLIHCNDAHEITTYLTLHKL